MPRLSRRSPTITITTATSQHGQHQRPRRKLLYRRIIRHEVLTVPLTVPPRNVTKRHKKRTVGAQIKGQEQSHGGSVTKDWSRTPCGYPTNRAPLACYSLPSPGLPCPLWRFCTLPLPLSPASATSPSPELSVRGGLGSRREGANGRVK